MRLEQAPLSEQERGDILAALSPIEGEPLGRFESVDQLVSEIQTMINGCRLALEFDYSAAKVKTLRKSWQNQLRRIEAMAKELAADASPDRGIPGMRKFDAASRALYAILADVKSYDLPGEAARAKKWSYRQGVRDDFLWTVCGIWRDLDRPTRNSKAMRRFLRAVARTVFDETSITDNILRELLGRWFPKPPKIGTASGAHFPPES